MGTKVINIIVEKTINSEGEVKSFWYEAGEGFDCRDGSINFTLHMFPGITFNLKDRFWKSRPDPEYPPDNVPTEPSEKKDDTIPF